MKGWFDMTLEQLANVVTKSEYLEGLGYFKTMQDAANEAKFLQAKDILIDGVKVNGTALTPDGNKDVDILIAVEKKTTANTGYAASYTIKANGVALSPDIDIPKDFLVKSATLETVETADVPYSGAVVGDKYIDFVINAKDASETAEHIYLPVNDLVDVYTAGNGLALSNGQFSVVVDSSNANGLSVGANGVAMALAVASTNGTGGSAGAISAADQEYINGLKSATLADITQSDIQALFTTT
jgi:hypothetical protein